MKAVLDTNVLLDVLQHREPWAADGQRIFLAAAIGQIEGIITAKQAADVYYITRKLFKGQDSAEEKARQVLSKLFGLFSLADVSVTDCRNALTLHNGDYEDAMLMETATRIGADSIITQNPKHFQQSGIPVFSPDNFVQLIDQSKG